MAVTCASLPVGDHLRHVTAGGAANSQSGAITDAMARTALSSKNPDVVHRGEVGRRGLLQARPRRSHPSNRYFSLVPTKRAILRHTFNDLLRAELINGAGP